MHLLGEIWGSRLADSISMFCVPVGDSVRGDWHQALP